MTEKNPVLCGNHGALRPSLLILIILCGLVPVASAKITIDFDPRIDFSKFKTFAYLGGVENLVSIQMNPDLIVRYWANPETQVDVTVMGNWGPYGPYIGNDWASDYNAVTSTSHHLGTLILDLIDPKAKALVWRAYLVRKMSDPDKDPKKAEDEFTESFKSFPPSEKEKDEKRQERARESQARKPA